jgi:hypothetical protein
VGLNGMVAAFCLVGLFVALTVQLSYIWKVYANCKVLFFRHVYRSPYILFSLKTDLIHESCSRIAGYLHKFLCLKQNRVQHYPAIASMYFRTGQTSFCSNL